MTQLFIFKWLNFYYEVRLIEGQFSGQIFGVYFNAQWAILYAQVAEVKFISLYLLRGNCVCKVLVCIPILHRFSIMA